MHVFNSLQEALDRQVGKKCLLEIADTRKSDGGLEQPIANWAKRTG